MENKMKRSAFTMIELVFVIVIIGILASVAIPKLAATRTDALALSLLQEHKNAVQLIRTTIAATLAKPSMITLFGAVGVHGNIQVSNVDTIYIALPGKRACSGILFSDANTLRIISVPNAEPECYLFNKIVNERITILQSTLFGA